MKIGNRYDHLLSGFSVITIVLVTIIALIIQLPMILTFFHFENKSWLLYVAMMWYAIGIFFPDMDHSKTKGGKFLTRLGIKYRHRGNLHSIVACLFYTITCSLIAIVLSIIGGLQLTIWIWVNGGFAFLGYMDHLCCDKWFDRKSNIPPANNPLKLWYIKEK